MPYDTGVSKIRICMLKIEPWLREDEEGRVTGVAALMLEDFSKALNFSYEFVAKSGIWGIKLPDGSWDGFFGMLQSNTSDLILIPTSANHIRMEAAHFCTPYYTSHLHIVSANRNKPPKNLFGILMTFDIELWIAVFVALILLAMISVLSERILQKVEGLENEESLTYEIMDAIIGYLGALFLEASQRDPKRDASRFTLMVWCLSVLTLMNAFMGQFKSSLMIQKDPPRIDSLEDLSRVKTERILAWKGSAFEDLLRNSKQESMMKVAKRVIESDGFVSSRTLFTEETLDSVVAGESILMTEGTTMQYYLGKRCAESKGQIFYLAKEPIVPVHFYMALNKRLPDNFKSGIDDRMYRLSESGLLSVWLNQMYRDWHKCTATTNERGEQTMGFSDFEGIFYLWFFYLMISTFALILELLYARKNRRVVK